MPTFVIALLVYLTGLTYGEIMSGAFIAQSINTIEYVFLQNSSVALSLYVLPETSHLRILICSENEQKKIVDSGDITLCDPSKNKACEYSSTASRSIVISHNITKYGKYYIHLVPCPGPVIVNWTANFISSGAHLSASLIPAVPIFFAAGFLWCFMALIYIVMIRYHWKNIQNIQKWIAIYPIIKIVFMYCATIFYNSYSKYGIFTTSEWTWYWLSDIVLQIMLFTLLLLLAKTGSYRVRLNWFDIITFFSVIIGYATLNALHFFMNISQLSQLLIWMLGIIIFVIMIAYVLSGATKQLQKIATTFQHSISQTLSQTNARNNTQNTIMHVQQVNTTNNSSSEPTISFALPEIWYIQHQLFVSYLFVLLIWTLLQILMYFVNIIFGTVSLNWIKLLTSELLNCIVFASIIYIFPIASKTVNTFRNQE